MTNRTPAHARRSALSSADHPVYAISVAAELTGTCPATLRNYERAGLVVPARTPGGTRRYSSTDLERVRRVQQLTAEGLSLAAVARILDLERRLAAARGLGTDLVARHDHQSPRVG